MLFIAKAHFRPACDTIDLNSQCQNSYKSLDLALIKSNIIQINQFFFSFLFNQRTTTTMTNNNNERVFILGGTGSIGKRVVKDLLAKKVPITLYARTPSKVESMYACHDGLLSIVQGDFGDLTPLKAGIQGHTRLLLLVAEFTTFAETKRSIAEIAYEAGVTQIVDISSSLVNAGWRTSFVGYFHYGGEKAVYDLPNRGYFVTLRPTRFMSNLLRVPVIDGKLYETIPGDRPQGWISPNDIGSVAAVVLMEDPAKHGDDVYTLVGDIRTPNERAQIVSRILGEDVSYIQIPYVAKYNQLLSLGGYFNHNVAIDLCGAGEEYDDARITPEISILLGREPETVEEFLSADKAALVA